MALPYLPPSKDEHEKFHAIIWLVMVIGFVVFLIIATWPATYGLGKNCKESTEAKTVK
jgi:uncharacterized membrane protein YiaA